MSMQVPSGIVATAVMMAVLTVPASAEWAYAPPFPLVSGTVVCPARNDSAIPLTVWIECVEATNDGTVESPKVCVDLLPNTACAITSTDSRCRRCKASWDGGVGRVSIAE